MILITGSSSYIGKNLINFFEKKKTPYIGIDLKKPYTSKCIKADIVNDNLASKVKSKITKIVHLAAISSDQDSKKNIDKCYDVNIFGTLNMINFAKVKKINKFVFASTEWVYGDFKNKKSSKSKIDISKLKSHYSITKTICEKIITNSIKLNYSILRFGIIYGNKIANFSAVESIVRQVAKKKVIKISSRKTARSFIHINDIVKSIHLSINYKKNDIFDIQGDKLVTLDEIIKISSNYLSKKIKILELNKKNPSIRGIASNLSHKKLNFRAKIGINEGIKLILNNEK